MQLFKFRQPDSVTPARHRRAVHLAVYLARTAGLAGLVFALLPHAARADQTLKPVHLRIGGGEVTFRDPALADDSEIYVPIDVLSAVGARGKLNVHADAVLVTTRTVSKPVELAVARPNGRRMIALSDLARLLSADIVRTELKDEDGHPIPGSKGDTVYLLARITEIGVANGAIHVATSFPAPFHAQMGSDEHPDQARLDCIGCTLPAAVHPAPLPAGAEITRLQPLHLSAAQYSIDTARIVLDLPRSVLLPETNGILSTDGSNVAFVGRRPGKAIAEKPAGHDDSGGNATKSNGPETRVAKADAKPDDKTTAAKSLDNMPVGTGKRADRANDGGAKDTTPQDQGEHVAVQRPGGLNKDDGMPTAPTTDKPAGDAQPNANGANGQNPDAVKADPARATLPSRSITYQRGGPLVEVRGVEFVPDDDTRVHINIMTSGRASSSPHYLDNGKLVIDIPNATVSLPDSGMVQQNFTHPLLTGIHVELLQETPPVTRVTLDTTRVPGFTVNTQSDRISIDVRTPRNSGGVFADKVVVIDPGHGGSSTGAISAGVVEKNLTLAISLKLRAYLEAAGAKVVMTRDRDTAIPLYDRPRLANAINADLFVSVHINDVDRANSASGTITFYHQGDASSRALAVCVQREIIAVSGLPNRGALSDGTLYASGLAVLRCSSMPAVLVEVGFINHQFDRRKMVNEDFQQHVAKAICDGLRHYVEGSPETVRRTPSSASIKGEKDRALQAVAQIDRD